MPARRSYAGGRDRCRGRSCCFADSEPVALLPVDRCCEPQKTKKVGSPSGNFSPTTLDQTPAYAVGWCAPCPDVCGIERVYFRRRWPVVCASLSCSATLIVSSASRVGGKMKNLSTGIKLNRQITESAIRSWHQQHANCAALACPQNALRRVFFSFFFSCTSSEERFRGTSDNQLRQPPRCNQYIYRASFTRRDPHGAGVAHFFFEKSRRRRYVGVHEADLDYIHTPNRGCKRRMRESTSHILLEVFRYRSLPNVRGCVPQASCNCLRGGRSALSVCL